MGYKFSTLIEGAFGKRKKAVGASWRMDLTYIKVKGAWMYLYRTGGQRGNSMVFLFIKRRYKRAAHLSLFKFIHRNKTVTIIIRVSVVPIEKPFEQLKKGTSLRKKIRQCKYSNNRVEVDPRLVSIEPNTCWASRALNLLYEH